MISVAELHPEIAELSMLENNIQMMEATLPGNEQEAHDQAVILEEACRRRQSLLELIYGEQSEARSSRD